MSKEKLISNKKFFKRYEDDFESHNGGAWLILMERIRHFEVEGYDTQHDDSHKSGELAEAGAYYALTHEQRVWLDNSELFLSANNGKGTSVYPFEPESFKPTPNDRIKELIKAGSFIAAEIDRLIRIIEKDSDIKYHPNHKPLNHE